MKKLMTFFLTFLLVFAMFTGCGEAPAESDTSGTDNTEATNTEEINTEGMGDKLSAAYVDMMKNGEYLMKYRVSMDIEGDTMEVETTVAVSGDDAAIISNVDGVESVIIAKDDKSYMVDHDAKTVFVMPLSPEEDDMVVETDGITYVGDGTEDGLVYEEYTTEDSTIRYYFDGKDLVKMGLTVENETIMMEVLELSDNIPDDIFNIPADYESISM